MHVEAVLTYKVIPTAPAPNGVLPDPPTYTACITWLGSPNGPLEAKTLPSTQRKARCEERLHNLKEKVLGFLLLYKWYEAEAKTKGLQLSEAVVEKNLRRFIREQLPGTGEYQRYLQATGMSQADTSFIQRLTALGEKVHNAIFKEKPGQEGPALTAFDNKWVAQTNCQPGYIVPGCKQYKGTQPPP